MNGDGTGSRGGAGVRRMGPTSSSTDTSLRQRVSRMEASSRSKYLHDRKARADAQVVDGGAKQAAMLQGGPDSAPSMLTHGLHTGGRITSKS